MKTFLFPLFLVSSLASAGEHVAIRQESILSKVGDVSVFRDETGWHIIKDAQIHRVPSCWVDPILRQMKENQLKAWQEHGYIIVNDLGSSEYGLRALGKVNGGGPILAGIAYWGIKSLCYGGLLAAAGGAATAAGIAVVGTGGAAAPAVAMGTAAAVGTIKAGIGVGLGASVAAAGISAAGGAGVAAGAVASTAATAGGVAGLMAAIECAAVAVAAAALAAPTP